MNYTLYCVYMHKNKINNKVYIGQTIFNDNPELRWGKYGQGYKHNSHFNNAIRKYGWDNFEHIILAKDLSKEEADELEIYYISLYNSTDREYGYNYRSGGGLNSKLAEESKTLISKHLKDYYKDNDIWNKGISMTNEVKNKLSESLKNHWSENEHPNLGKHHSEESKQQIAKSVSQYYSIHNGPNKGKQLTDEEKCKISESVKQLYANGKHPRLGKHHSTDTKNKLSKIHKGRKWMNNGKINKCVKLEEIDFYLNLGYKFGRDLSL